MEYVCPNIFFPINPNGVLTIAWLLLDICGINSIVIWNVEKTLTHNSKVNITECEAFFYWFHSNTKSSKCSNALTDDIRKARTQKQVLSFWAVIGFSDHEWVFVFTNS